MSSKPISIVWFRHDLRIDDNPALDAGVKRGTVVPVFIWAPDEEKPWQPGGALRYWLHYALLRFSRKLQKHKAPLILREGNSLDQLRKLIKETGADAVFWNRRYEPAITRRDTQIKTALRDEGIIVKTFNGSLLYEPWQIKNGQGNPYKVFTPFWKACLAAEPPAKCLGEPESMTYPGVMPDSISVDDLNLLPEISWAEGIHKTWSVETQDADSVAAVFLRGPVSEYEKIHDRMDIDKTSRLSPYLVFGEVSVRKLWHDAHAVRKKTKDRDSAKGIDAFLRQLSWRDFANSLLFYYPHTDLKPLREEFARFGWEKKRTLRRAWEKGETGYPVVDAAMRQLWKTGWMHNRARLIVASFLVKDLLQPWQDGARWFWDTLVDADLANNSMNWQWTAGSGADAAPFFRIFNPVTQGQRFDPDGEYIRKWVPELATLNKKWIHEPWSAPEEVLSESGIRLGQTYPERVVDHAFARRKALAAFDKIRKK